METDVAPPPVGAYVHYRREGDLLFLAGVGPRLPDGSGVAGGATRDEQDNAQEYDVVAPGSYTQLTLPTVCSG